VVLILIVLVILVAVALFHSWEGLFGAAIAFFNVLIAGFVAFCLFEPLAGWLGGLSDAVDAYADALCITVLFLLSFLALRFITAYVAPKDLEFPEWPRRIGGGLFGLMTGYVIAGIFICLLQTLPLREKFLGYDAKQSLGLGGPDRVWLATMHRASGQVFRQWERKWFDADGSFIPRYARYRRLAEEKNEPQRNRGEFPSVLGTKPPEE
jgi:hypothetical protein